jgi:hypothetical protein
MSAAIDTDRRAIEDAIAIIAERTGLTREQVLATIAELHFEEQADLRIQSLETGVEWRARSIAAVAHGPSRRLPELHDKVVPVPERRKQLGWKGGRYTVRVCKAKGWMLAGVCASCHAPIDPCDLYVPRNGSLPLCVDCVEVVV